VRVSRVVGGSDQAIDAARSKAGTHVALEDAGRTAAPARLAAHRHRGPHAEEVQIVCSVHMCRVRVAHSREHRPGQPLGLMRVHDVGAEQAQLAPDRAVHTRPPLISEMPEGLPNVGLFWMKRAQVGDPHVLNPWDPKVGGSTDHDDVVLRRESGDQLGGIDLRASDRKRPVRDDGYPQVVAFFLVSAKKGAVQ
jgi:hypothetical protein